MTRLLRGLAAGLGVVMVALFTAALSLAVRVGTEDVVEGAIWGTAVTLLGVIGSDIAFRRPRNRIGWLLIIAGLGETFAGAATLYFPTGHAPSRWWRWVGWLGAAGVSMLFLSTLNVALFHPDLGLPVLLAAAPVALLSLVVRSFRSSGEERQQIKLLVYAVSITVAWMLILNLTAIELPPWAEAVATATAIPSIGIATLVAVLRYRLFDLDQLQSELAAVAARALQPTSTVLWLRSEVRS